MEEPMTDPSPSIKAVVRTLALSGVLLWSLFEIGCYFHKSYKSEQNRPGHTDVSVPPPQQDKPERVHPKDPGAWYIAGSIRPLFEIGATSRQGDRQRTYQAGGELTLSYRTDVPVRDAPFPSDPFVHRTMLLPHGLVVGWLPYTSSELAGARFYAEFDARIVPLARISAGWSVQPVFNQQGPQVTVGLFETTYIRWNWDLGHESSLMFGMSIPFYAIYTRSH